MDRFDLTIIGAGVVGLAVAEALSHRHKKILVLEKNDGYGQETSSRNSEVIHAGIYYPTGSLKAQLCLEGNRRLYDICRERNIPHWRIGKLIVATDPGEADTLREKKSQAEANGVEDLSFLSQREIAALEPEVRAVEALFSPSTGIVDSHGLMRSFYVAACANGATVAFRSEASAVHYNGRAYDIETNGGEFRFETKILINSAGLGSDEIAVMAGIDIDRAGYRLKYCKGSYFAASPSPKLNHLVYPVPTKNNEGLGVHATLDLGGRVRFGPDVEYVPQPDYGLDETKLDPFCNAIQAYLPGVRREDLHPDMAGIRPKLQGPGEPVRDFVIQDETERGLPGLINLIGIESPGLTSCLAIARRIDQLAGDCL